MILIRSSVHIERLSKSKGAPPIRPMYATVSRRRFSLSMTLLINESGTEQPSSAPQSTREPTLNIREYLSKPSWSVKSLLPGPEETAAQPPGSSQQLRHLLRLSALPPPKDVAEEATMLETLASQLYFVQKIQKVDTTGVEPLRALRDESIESEKANEITLASLKEALDQEEVVGEHYKRIRRKQDHTNDADNPQGWKPLNHARRKVGKFFVVDTGPAPSA